MKHFQCLILAKLIRFPKKYLYRYYCQKFFCSIYQSDTLPILFKYSLFLFLFSSSFSSLSPSTSGKPIPSKITTKNHPNQQKLNQPSKNHPQPRRSRRHNNYQTVTHNRPKRRKHMPKGDLHIPRPTPITTPHPNTDLCANPQMPISTPPH